MSAIPTAIHPRRGFRGGVHPYEGKHFAENAAIEALPTPKQVAIPLLQHLGKPAECLVKSKQEVALGELLGKPAGFISASVHATPRPDHTRHR